MNKFLVKDSEDNWNTTPPVPNDKIGDVNCHRFVLYVIGKMSWEEMISDAKAQKEAGVDFIFSKKAQRISDSPFTPIKDLESLLTFVNESCEPGKAYVGQILDIETGELAHSFIIEKEQNEEYLCYDKPGFKYAFNVHALEHIFEFVNKDNEKPYYNQKWRFLPLENF